MMRFLTGSDEEFAAMIEIKAARLGFGILIALDGQHAAVFRNAKDGNNAGGAIAGVEVTAIGRQVNIRRPANAGEIRRHHVQRLHALDFAVRVLQLPDVNGAVQFVNAVAVLLVRMEDHMTRASAFNGGHLSRFLGSQETVVAQGKQADTILFQRRNPQGAIVRGNICRVAAFQPFHHRHRFPRQAVHQRRNAYAARVIGCAEHKAALMIGRDVRWATGQRGFASEGQGAIIGRNAVGQYAKLRTHADVEILFVRAHHHRLHLPRGINNLHQGQFPLRIQIPDVNLLAFRAGGINGLFHEYSFLTARGNFIFQTNGALKNTIRIHNIFQIASRQPERSSVSAL